MQIAFPHTGHQLWHSSNPNSESRRFMNRFQRPAANGAMIRETNFPTVWYVRNGQRCPMAGPPVFGALGLTPADVEIVTWEDVRLLPEGPGDDGHLGPTQIDPAAAALGWKTPYLHVYSHDYFQGSQHIESRTRIWSDGTVEGFFQYHNDSMMGFCGGVAIAMLDTHNLMVHASAPPSGCINGKPPGHEVTREVAWGDRVDAETLKKITRVISKAYPTTKGGINIDFHTVADILKVAIAAAGSGGGS